MAGMRSSTLADLGVGRAGLALLAQQFAVAAGQAAQGVVVDAQLREGGRDFLVAPGEVGLLGLQANGFIAQAWAS
jgi:hypothetical protein